MKMSVQSFAVLGAMFCLICCGMAKAQESQPTVQSLYKQIQSLTDEVRELRATQNQTWLSERRAEEAKILVKDVLNDANTRASMMENSMTAGYHNGFFLASEDGNFKLRILGMIEARYVHASRENSGGDNDEGGFDICRTRFGFKGHILNPQTQFFIWTGHSATGSYIPLDVWIKRDLGDGWAVQAGAFKVQFFKEWLISETSLQMIERSPLTSVFGGSYTEGINLLYGDDRFKAVVSLNDGLNQRVSNFTAEDAEAVALTTRVDYLLTGSWNQAKDTEAWTDEPTMIAIGGALHYEVGEYGTTTDEARTLQWTADIQAEFGGWNIFAAVVGNQIDDTTTKLNQLGVLIQAGMFLTPDFELTSSYAWGDSDIAGEEEMQILSIGFNKFFNRHALKLSGDLGYSLNAIPSTFAKQGWQVDNVDEDGQILARAQLQLLF
ncbi:MAG TPA: hypothetical protein DCM28_10555 [Phycisphaerales bacterium]|nr:hypothetical protein [Phycisphaerales bacterium]|tara:strand:- start:38050 stop:39360 length:1311 start_codon:yes stop_codon:yes gene_type:complete